jgi:hypothetical protein
MLFEMRRDDVAPSDRRKGRQARVARRPTVEVLEERQLLFSNGLLYDLKGPPRHEEITTMALGFLKDDALQRIIAANVVVDFVDVSEGKFNPFSPDDPRPENHFDGSEFLASSQNINRHYRAAVEAADPNNFRPNNIASEFGRLLHTAQDFYAHTNWVEYIQAGFIERGTLIDSDNGFWTELTPYMEVQPGVVLVEGEDETPTTSFGDATLERNVFADPTITHSNVTVTFAGGRTPPKKGLISGVYGGGLENAPDNIEMQHGDETTLSLDVLNQDRPFRPLHFVASALAFRQTENEFRRLLNLIQTRQGSDAVYKLLCEWVRPEQLASINAKIGNFSVAVVPVIDRSASMGDNGKLAAAQQAANNFVNLLDGFDEVGVVDFDDVSTVDFPLSKIVAGSNVRQQAQQAINGLTPRGDTSVGAGVRQADFLLDRASSPIRAMVILSDGMENTDPKALDVINAQVDPCVRIFTIALGNDADTALLRQIAQLRNGKFFFAPTPGDLQSIYSRLSGELSDEQDTLRTKGAIVQGEQRSQSFLVDPTATQLTVGLQWPGSDLDLYLVAPDGTVITRDTFNSNVRFIGGATSEFFKVQTPLPGVWQAIFTAVATDTGVESFELFTRVDSPLKAQLAIGQDVYNVGERSTVRVHLTDGLPILGASVFAVATPPDGSGGTTRRIQLFDDGMHDDGLDNDGVYGGSILAGTAGAGSYLLQIEAEGTSNDGFRFVRAPSQALLITGQGRAVEDLTGPTILSVRRQGFHLQPTRLSLAFNEELDPMRANNTANYNFVLPGRDRRFGTRDDQFIPVRSAAYDSATQTVTLLPSRRIRLNELYQIQVNGTTALGVSDLVGNRLDGDGDSRPGGDYSVRFRRFGVIGNRRLPNQVAHKVSRDALKRRHRLGSQRVDPIVTGQKYNLLQNRRDQLV